MSAVATETKTVKSVETVRAATRAVRIVEATNVLTAVERTAHLERERISVKKQKFQ